MKYFKYFLLIIISFFLLTVNVYAADDSVLLKWSNNDSDFSNIIETFLTDNIYYKDGYVSINVSLDGKTNLIYYDQNGKINSIKTYNNILFFDTISVDDYLYTIGIENESVQDLSLGSLYGSDASSNTHNLYLYKINKELEIENRELVSSNTFIIYPLFSLVADIFGYNFINYRNNQLNILNYSIYYDEDGNNTFSLDIISFDKNLNQSNNFTVINYDELNRSDLSDSEATVTFFKSIFRRFKPYFPDIYMFGDEIIDFVVDVEQLLIDYKDTGEIPNNVDLTLYLSHNITDNYTISTGIHAKARLREIIEEIINKYPELSDSDIELTEDEKTALFLNFARDVVTAVKDSVNGTIRILDSNNNVILNKDVNDYFVLINPKYSNNHIITLGFDYNFNNLFEQKEISLNDVNTDILVFNVGGEVIQSIISEDEKYLSVVETPTGFVTTGISILNSSCALVSTIDGGTSGASETFAEPIARSMIKYSEDKANADNIRTVDDNYTEMITRTGDPSIMPSVQFKVGDTVEGCAMGCTKSFRFNDSITNPSTKNKSIILVIILGITIIGTLFITRYHKEEN